VIHPALCEGDERGENDASAPADFHGFESSRSDQSMDRPYGDVELRRGAARRGETSNGGSVAASE
jgi:hypothetical protein